MSKKINIVIGSNGQIGSYLCELLTGKDEYTIGVVRRSSTDTTSRLVNVKSLNNFKLRCADVTDIFSLSKLFNEIITDKENEYVIYNLAAMSFVKESFAQPQVSLETTGSGHLNVLEALLPFHKHGFKVKTFFMASSEMWGGNVNNGGFQNLNVPFYPNSPYGLAKLYGYHINRIYRESYNMFNVAGIIFNSESPRRGEEFVTRKITKWFAQFMKDDFILRRKILQLGYIDSCRDWTHAKDTVNAIYLIANNILPKDYIVSSGETHTVKSFLFQCYKQAQVILGKGCLRPLEDCYHIDASFFRPNEVKYLRGDNTPIREELGWKPTYNFEQLVYDMLYSDYEHLMK